MLRGGHKAWQTGCGDGTREGGHTGQPAAEGEGHLARGKARCVVRFVGHPFRGFTAQCDDGAQRHVQSGADERQPVVHEPFPTALRGGTAGGGAGARGAAPEQ